MTWFPDPEDPRWKLRLKGTWQLGKESGYPWCDRLWFLVRGFLCNNVFGWGLQRKYSDWMHKFEFYEGISHIPCPWHLFLAWIGWWKPRYGRCKPCDWDQLITPLAHPCAKCGKMLSPMTYSYQMVKVRTPRGVKTVRIVKVHVGRKQKDLDN